MNSLQLSRSSRASSKSSYGGEKSPTVWITFTGYSGEDVRRGYVVFEFSTENSKKEFSHVVHTTSTGHFRNPVECALEHSSENNFTLHRLESSTERSLRVDDISFNTRKMIKPLIHFSLDLYSISRRLADAKDGKVTQTVSSAEGYSVTFEAHSSPPIPEEEVSTVSSFRENEDSLSARTTSLYSLGVDSNESTWSVAATDGSRRSRKLPQVHFDKDVHEIPTTRQLQGEIQQAAEERSKLSQTVGDLSLQLLQLKHEMRDIKEALKQVTDMFASQNRKLELEEGKGKNANASKRRRVVLDGNSISKAYGGADFKVEGMEIALKYYLNKGMNAVVVLPESKAKEILEDKRGGKYSHERERLKHIVERGMLSLIPLNIKKGAFIVKYAVDRKADIISNESFRYVADSQSSKKERRKLRTFLEEHRVPFSFIEDHFISSPLSSALSLRSHSQMSVACSDTV